MKKLISFFILSWAFTLYAQTPIVSYTVPFPTRIKWLTLDNTLPLMPDSLYGKTNGNLWTVRANVNDLFISKGSNNWNTAYSWGNHAGLYRTITWVPGWTDVTGKPVTFAPSAHTHSIADVTNLQTTLDTKITENQTITLSGDITGVGKTTLVTTLATIGTAGTYTKVTTDAKGRIIAGAQATYSDVGAEPVVSAGTTLQYYRGDKTWQTLNKTAVGLPNVDNTADLNKPISNAIQTALNVKQTVRKEFIAIVTPTTANGYVIDYSSAGFTVVPVIQITPQTTTTPTLLSLPLVVLGTATTTQCPVYILNSGSTTVSLLGAIVQGLGFATSLTGVKLNVYAIQP